MAIVLLLVRISSIYRNWRKYYILMEIVGGLLLICLAVPIVKTKTYSIIIGTFCFFAPLIIHSLYRKNKQS